MGEVYYIWADINSAREQIAFSSIVKAMINKGMVAVVRMINRDGAEAKLGIAMPRHLDEIDCLIWVQVYHYEARGTTLLSDTTRCHLQMISANTRFILLTSSTTRRAK